MEEPPADSDEDDVPRELRPAPEAWIARALELPQLEQAANTLENGTADDAEMRAALQAVGLEPDERRLRSLAQLLKLRNHD